MYRQGTWYLLATCEVAEAPAVEVAGMLGVDLGVSNIATDSDGTIYTGTPVKQVRHRHRRLRQKRQKKGTLSAKRRLRKLAGKEARFARDINHCISQKLVQTAERTKRGMALEDLTHIRTRGRATRPQRAGLHAWAFAQLQAFIAYKARRAGLPVCHVDLRNTSRTCPTCGHCAKANRRSQAVFLCTACGTAGHADVIAAGNIARRAVVMQPYVSEAAGAVAPETSPGA